MEIRERNLHYQELADMKKEEQEHYNQSMKNSPRINTSMPSMSNLKAPNIKIPKYF